ncbi:MAG: DUF3225 domain-containing protein [Lautropia sp.]|nr:DUF3225 domain-containing protein [Lautropia sp.]
MSSNPYAHHSANAAQNTFYQALADADIEALMSVWVNDDAVLCILPSGERLVGQDAIRETHEDVFTQGPVRVSYQELQSFETGTVSVHHVLEQFEIEGHPELPNKFLAYATNVFLRTPGGWQLMLHHSSQAAGEVELPAILQPDHLH